VKWIFWLFGLMGSAYAQGVPFAVNPPAPNSQITVCGAPAQGGNPCTNQIPIYADVALSQVIPQPASLDASGNFTFFYDQGSAPVQVQITGRTDVISGGGSGSGIFAGPRPWIDCSASPYNAPFTLGATVPTVNAGPALRACIAALPTSGGTIRLNPGRYGISTAVADTQNAQVAINLAQKNGVRLECGTSAGINQSGTSSRPCSIELITGIPAGTIAIECGPYTGSGGTYAGPKFSNITVIDNTATGGAGFAMKDCSDEVFESPATDGFTYAGLSAPATPTVTAVAGGALGATVTVFVQIAHRTGWGTSLPSAETSATTDGTCPGSGNCTVRVALPATPGAPALDAMVYASTVTATEVSQNACCTGAAYGTNFDIAAAPSGSGLQPEVSNHTRGTGIVFTGTNGWGNSTGFVNHAMIMDFRSGKNTQMAFAHSAQGVTGVNYFNGDIICNATTAGQPCSVITDNTQFFGTHWESGTGRIFLSVDGTNAHRARGFGAYGILMESATTGISMTYTAGAKIFAHMTTMTNGILNDSHSGTNEYHLTYASGTITNPIVDNAPGNNFACANGFCGGMFSALTMGPAGGAGKLLFSQTAPTISSGFGSSPTISVTNGTASFRVNVGTGGAASSGVIAMPTASAGWNCQVNNITAAAAHRADNTRQTASATGTVTVENQTTSTGAAVAWGASDILSLNCGGN